MLLTCPRYTQSAELSSTDRLAMTAMRGQESLDTRTVMQWSLQILWYHPKTISFSFPILVIIIIVIVITFFFFFF